MYPDCTESADCFSLAGAPSSSAKSKLGPAKRETKGERRNARQRVSASGGKTLGEGEGGGRGRAGGSTPTRGRDRRGKDDIDRSRVDLGIPRSVGGRCHRRNGRRTSPPRDGRSPPRSMVPRPQQKSAPAPVSCRPRARDRRTARLSRYSQKPVYVTERVAFASGVLASRASPGRLGRDPSGRRWTAPRGERKSACAITFGVGKPPRREPRGSNAHAPRLDRSSAITRTSALGVRCG